MTITRASFTVTTVTTLVLLAYVTEATRISTSLTQSTAKSQGRHLFDTSSAGSSTCYWEERNSQCEAHRASASPILREGGNDFSQLVADFIDCRESFTNVTCSQDYCQWDARNDVCVYTGFGIGRETSPCYKPAPGTNQLGNVGRLCSIFTEAEPCNAEARCTWGRGGCALDTLALFTSFTTLQYATATVFKTQQVNAAIPGAFDISQEDFDWNTILNWTIPQTPCPRGIPQEACDMADAVLSETVPSNAYCSLRYRDPSLAGSCQNDAVCIYNNESKNCGGLPAAAFFFKAADPFVNEETDRLFVSIIGKCSAIADATQCSESDQCIWNPASNSCGIDSTMIFDKLVSFARDSPDAICTYHRLALESGCLDIFYENACLANVNCHWNQFTQRCGRDIYYLIKSAVHQDLNLAQPYNDLNSRCSPHRNRDECEKESDSP